ncbi:hypothetical protein [Dyella silvatica]|uniref:hypothetical protein n=1 Tax=Dyella silvatica TaxID=2992128 RepID=UPI0022541131|nr:hypothetical protein [Dyella silvatica]
MRWMPATLLIALCVAGFAHAGGALAPGKDGADVAAGSPLRQQLNTALHASEAGYDGKYVYKVMWASDRYAYACYLMQDKDGVYSRTDESIDMSRRILKKQGGNWVLATQIDGFASTKDAPECNLVFDGSIDNELLEHVIRAYPLQN